MQLIFAKITTLILLISTLSACTTHYSNQMPINQAFPSVSGTSLEGKSHLLPDDFNGQPVLFLIGYVQNAQFDIDRWLIGLDMTNTQVNVFELPTIQGMFPKMFQTQIDNGMRRGIPKEIWKGVITIYEDGEKVQAFTGNALPNNARVVLLNQSGNIVYFYDRGFSVSALNELRDQLNQITP